MITSNKSINRNICFIPVRKGSKGIIGKNSKKLVNKPLICWVLDVVLSSGIADEVWIATDCSDMEQLLCEIYKDKLNIFRRCKENAQDSSPTIDVVLEFLTAFQYKDTDNLILLQATSPFTSAEELKLLARGIEDGEKDSYIACTRLKKFSWDDNGKPLNYSLETKPRRQEYKGLLIETGSFYASTVGAIVKSKQLISGKIEVIEVSSPSIIDIDEELDWLMAETYINYTKQCSEL
jgi:CMP-N-acetylneuraminic acid synthetase